MIRPFGFGLAALLLPASGGAARGADSRTSPPEQWYTGSLFSPSPAEAHAGVLTLEPYLQGGAVTGRFNDGGALRPLPGASDSLSEITLLKYGLTDRLSLYLLPGVSFAWNGNGATDGVRFADLPVELQWRVIDAVPAHLVPSVTLYGGFSAPTGRFSRLRRAADGTGSGVWFARYGALAQSTVRFGGHDARLRVWAVGRDRLDDAGLDGISAYGTPSGFRGRARPGFNGNAGSSLEYGLSRRWVLALDAYRLWNDGAAVTGTIGDAPVSDRRNTPSSGSWNLGPAIEYSWSASTGVIAGVIVPVSGHDTADTISPQIALNMVF